MINKKFTDSTTVREAWYYPENKELIVEFTTGKRYSYAGVPEEIWNGFISAASAGVYLSNKVKGQYPYKLVTE